MTRILIVEDDFSSRRMMQKTLEEYGAVDAVVDGEEAVQAYMMPRMDGQEALRQIRKLEQEAGVDPVREVRVVMTTVLEDPHNVVSAYFKGGATAYIVKPVDRLKIKAEMTKFGLLPGTKS